MKKLVNVFFFGSLLTLFCNCIPGQIDQQNNNDLEFLIAEAIKSSAENVVVERQHELEHTVLFVDSRKILEHVENGPEFLKQYEEVYREYMLLGMQIQKNKGLTEEEKELIFLEASKKVLMYQRHLRSYLEPLFTQKALELGVDIIFDSYTGSLIYMADDLELEGIAVRP